MLCCVALVTVQSNLQRFVCAVLHVSERIWCLYDNDKFIRQADFMIRCKSYSLVC
jgi:type IV secretory pathway VirB3-like protein